jgi:hypothetical protein
VAFLLLHYLLMLEAIRFCVILLISAFLLTVHAFSQPSYQNASLCIDADELGRVRGKWYLLKDEKVVAHGAVRDTCTRLNVPTTGQFTLSVLVDGRLTRRIPFRADTLRAGYVFRLRNEQWVNQLGEVVVRGGSRFSQQGDTLVIRTDDVETRPFGDATELFDNIAGLQVRSDGSVWIMGQRVYRLDVDGRALFGGDPTATLTMLRADMIASLRVTELPSETGKKSLSVSVQLKKDRKNGQYGEAGAGLGTLGRYDLAARYNRLLPGAALNGFLTGNTINRRGLNWADFMNHAKNESIQRLTGVTSAIQAMTKGGIDRWGDEEGIGLHDWTGNAPGLSRVLSGGLNGSLTTKTGEVLGYVMASHHDRTLQQHQQIETYLNPFVQRVAEYSQQQLAPAQLISSLSGKWQAATAGTFAIKNTFYANRDTQQQFNRQQIELLPDSSGSTLTETYLTRQTGLNNHVQMAWAKRGKKGGANTSIYAHHRYATQHTTEENRVVRSDTPLPYEPWRAQQMNSHLAGIQAIKSWPLSKHWLIEGRSNAAYQHYVANTTMRFGRQPEAQPTRTSGRFDVENWLAQVDVYALYRYQKWTLTGGLAGWSWQSARRFGNQALPLSRQQLLPTAAVVYTQSSRTKYVLRVGSDVDQPTPSRLNPVVDSSRLQRVTAGQFDLGISPRQFVQADISLTQLTPVLGVNIDVMVSKTDLPIVTELTTLGAGFIRSSPVQIYQPNRELVANLTLVRVSMQSPVQWFMFNTYLHRESYQLVNGRVGPNQLQLFTNAQNIKWQVRNGVKLDLNWNTTATSINGKGLNWLHKATVRSDLKINNRLYIEPTGDYWLTNSLGQQDSFLLANLQVDFYAMKNRGLRITGRALNVFDQQRQISTTQTGNGIVITEQTVLPRTLMLGVTFFPEKWL